MANDALSSVMWTKRFLEAQSYPVKRTVFYQDNKSTMLLQRNGRESTTRRTRHINIRIFYFKDHLDRKEFELEYCPTDNMLADYITKLLQGEKFKQFRKLLMNL